MRYTRSAVTVSETSSMALIDDSPHRLPKPTIRDIAGLAGVSVPVVQAPYFSFILSGAAEALYEHDMRIVLCPTQHEHDREVSLLERVVDGVTDGALLVLPEESNDELRALRGHGYRFVVVDPL